MPPQTVQSIEPIVACAALEIHTALGLVAAGLGGSLVARSISIGSRKDIAFVDIADLVGDASTAFAVTAAGTPDKPLGALLESLHAAGRDLESELAAKS